MVPSTRFGNAARIHNVRRVEWMVATTVKNQETTTTTRRTQTQEQARNQCQNQNRRSENEKRNPVRASQNVRIFPLPILREFYGNRWWRRRWTSYRGRVRKRNGGRTENTGNCQRLVVSKKRWERTSLVRAYSIRGSWTPCISCITYRIINRRRKHST